MHMFVYFSVITSHLFISANETKTFGDSGAVSISWQLMWTYVEIQQLGARDKMTRQWQNTDEIRKHLDQPIQNNLEYPWRLETKTVSVTKQNMKHFINISKDKTLNVWSHLPSGPNVFMFPCKNKDFWFRNRNLSRTFKVDAISNNLKCDGSRQLRFTLLLPYTFTLLWKPFHNIKIWTIGH